MPPVRLSKFEFVALIAAVQAVDVLAIDIMLPALPQIGAAFSVLSENDRPLVITFFLLGFGLPQIIFGPLIDRFGRRLPILLGLGVYIVCVFAALAAGSFAALLAFRFVQGIGAAAVRVAIGATVRDLYSGEEMAKISSLVLAIFLLVPILMPSIGQLILLVEPWQAIFVAMGGVALALVVWTWFRLRETQAPEDRRPLTFTGIAQSFALVLGNRRAFFYGISGMFLYAVVLGLLINTSQQILVGVYGLGVYYPLALGLVAAVAAVSSLTISRFIGRLGLQRGAHLACVALLTATVGATAVSATVGLPLWGYLLFGCLVPLPLVTGFTTTGRSACNPWAVSPARPQQSLAR
jgi:MFS transporter, DHA1 family, multidrug resistance protein